MGATVTRISEEELARFEARYAEAERTGSRDAIPWDHDRPNPTLVEFLDTVAPSLVRCGSRAAVVGCGRGHDAREVIRRGYEVVAFDCAPTAIRLAKALDPENEQRYFRADLFEPPARWLRRFELVIDVHTLQALPPEYRPATMEALGRLVGSNGHLLLVTRCVEQPVGHGDGPPWPLTEAELRELVDGAGLEIESLDCFVAGEPPARRMRALLQHRG